MIKRNCVTDEIKNMKKRGRRPIGDKAMSDAERQRRCRERKRGDVSHEKSHEIPGHEKSHEKLLQARIRELEAELERECKRHAESKPTRTRSRHEQEFELDEIKMLKSDII